MATGDILAQVADQRTVEEILQKIADGNEGIENNFKLVNSTIGTSNPVPLDTIILQAVIGNVFEYTAAGTYTLQIPATVSKIKVTACGAGGGGGGGEEPYYGGGGGGGGDAVVDAEYAVTPQSLLTITVGAGGAGASGNSNGTNGGATTISGVVTLAGGSGGIKGTSKNHTGSGGAGAGNGGNGGAGNWLDDDMPSTTITSQPGAKGLVGNGGAGASVTVRTEGAYTSECGIGGGGGGSLGNGGSGNTHQAIGTKPTRGGGGGGRSKWYNGSNTVTRVTKGADGYVKITWGY